MPAKDKYHDIVITALRKANCDILSEQVSLRIGDRRLWVDLRVNTSDQEIILIEIKSYDTIDSPVAFLHQSIGQYLTSRAILEKIGQSEKLYLAVPDNAYNDIFVSYIGQTVLETYQVNLLVYNVYSETIEQWIHNS